MVARSEVGNDRAALQAIYQFTNKHQIVSSITFFALTLWAVRYWGSRNFGLYEDDLTFIPNAVQMNFDELIRFISTYLTHLYGHGRPLSDSFIHLFSWLGWRLSGLETIYIFGYLIVFGNAALFYLLVRRVYSQPLAFIAGCFFVLYSADTTQAYLTHSLGLFPSMLFLLLAFHAYLSKRNLLAYAAMAVALITYETTYFVFLVAPLIGSDTGGKRKLCELLRHTVIVGLIFLLAIILRARIGDDRLADIQGLALVLTPIRHMLIGPIVSISSYLLRSYQILRELTIPHALWLIPAFVVFMALFLRVNTGNDQHPGSYVPPRDPDAGNKIRKLAAGLSSQWDMLSAEQRRLIFLLVTSLLMVILAYPLTFTTRSFSISGRATRVHFAAAPGVALFWGILLYAALTTHIGFIARALSAGVFALVIPLTFMFGFQIQADYKLAWGRQQAFWEELLPLISSASDGVVILVNPAVFKDVEQIDANTWNLPRVLPQLFDFPEDWADPPMVYRLVPGWEGNILTVDGNFNLFNLTVTAPPSVYREVVPSRIIYIVKGLSGSMERREALKIGGNTYKLLGSSTPIFSRFDEALLFKLLGLHTEVVG